jgi:hypothetical protein
MQQTRISFPELQLHARDAHKLRGYFGNLFRERSPLLHNHLEGGTGFRQGYPLVHYKVIDRIPMLVGYNEGAMLLLELFQEIKEIELEGQYYPIQTKNIECQLVEAGYTTELLTYRFETLWMPLSQRNYQEWKQGDAHNRQQLLHRLLINQTVGALRGVDCGPKMEERLLCQLNVQPKYTHFKNQRMQAFTGSFIINAYLPDYFAIGKSVSRGFGTILSHGS